MSAPAANAAPSPADGPAGGQAVRPAVDGRARRRRLWFGLLTVLGLAERGFFIPHRYAKARRGPGERPAYPAVETLFASNRARFRAVLGLLDGYAGDLLRIGGAAGRAPPLGPDSAPTPQPRWEQGWFPRLDAAVAYALVREHAPRRIVEIGSGHSTRFLARAVADGGLATRIQAIDPAPRAALGGLAVEVHRATLQERMDDGRPAPFDDLGPGDILSIDSSHVLVPGSDVDILLGRVLPALPPGVMIQIHDVFLPDDYPASWDWRGYNEQLGILPILLGGRFEVLFASRYVVTRMAAAVAASLAARLPLGAGPGREAPESSLWLRVAESGA